MSIQIKSSPPLRVIFIMIFILVPFLVYFEVSTFEEVEAAAVCRPSAPSKAVHSTDDLIILYLGNSIVFDHDWNIPTTFPINCGRQGLIASELDDYILPAFSPDLIVIGFGTVEILRAASAGGPADAALFEEAMSSIIVMLERQYPGVPVLLLGIPNVEFADPTLLNDFNEVLSEIAQCRKLFFAPISAIETYDGVHLTVDSYTFWHWQVESVLTRL